jgi:hypothetical protein
VNGVRRKLAAFLGVSLSLIGVALAALLAAAWWHSEVVSDAACWRLGRHGVLIRTVPGRLHIVLVWNCGWEEHWVVHLTPSPDTDNELWSMRAWPSLPVSPWRYVGFGVDAGEGWVPLGSDADSAYLGVAAPFWAWMLLPGLPSAVYLSLRARRLRRTRRRRMLKLCERCGYDLRATPERCPECGMVVKARAIAWFSRPLHFGFRRA